MKPTVTYTSNSAQQSSPLSNKENIKLNYGGKVQTSTQTFGMAGDNGANSERPWLAYYVTSDDFFEILRVAFDDTYGSGHKWHPEDLYVNVSCVLEVVSNTLANMVRIKTGKELSGVKGS